MLSWPHLSCKGRQARNITFGQSVGGGPRSLVCKLLSGVQKKKKPDIPGLTVPRSHVLCGLWRCLYCSLSDLCQHGSITALQDALTNFHRYVVVLCCMLRSKWTQSSKTGVVQTKMTESHVINWLWQLRGHGLECQHVGGRHGLSWPDVIHEIFL